MKETQKNSPQKKTQCLLCISGDELGGLSPDFYETAPTPLKCLGMAFDAPPALIAVVIPASPVWERVTRLELCAELKRIRATKLIPILALLQSPHREIMEALHRVGTEYMVFVGQCALEDILPEIIFRLDSEYAAHHRLANVCPYLNYRPVDAGREMAVCGAYRDRLVLGARTLKELCHEPDHEHCSYFLDAAEAR